MALSTVQTFLAFILFVINCNMTIANPIPSGSQTTYEIYAELANETKRLWIQEDELFNEFKSDRFPNTEVVTVVDVPNLLLTENMTRSWRKNASNLELLSGHGDYLLHYKYITDYVLADEENTTSATNFISDMKNIKRSILSAIEKLDNAMIHLGHLPKTQTEIPEGQRPYFNPEWERNVINRYKRDVYVLEQMEMQLTNAVQDFFRMRDLAAESMSRR